MASSDLPPSFQHPALFPLGRFFASMDLSACGVWSSIGDCSPLSFGDAPRPGILLGRRTLEMAIHPYRSDRRPAS
jgi:hypothetical protein